MIIYCEQIILSVRKYNLNHRIIVLYEIYNLNFLDNYLHNGKNYIEKSESL